MCMSVFCLHLPCLQCPQGPKEGNGSCETVVIDCCHHNHVDSGNPTQVFLTSEPPNGALFYQKPEVSSYSFL